MDLYGKRQRSPAENGQVVKPQEPTSLNNIKWNRPVKKNTVPSPDNAKCTLLKAF